MFYIISLIVSISAIKLFASIEFYPTKTLDNNAYANSPAVTIPKNNC